jgi:ribosome-binding factor A
VVSKLRLERIEERIHQDLSEIILQEVGDPRLVGVSITGVKVDRELAYADIYISSIEGIGRSAEILDALNHAQGYLRTGLANRVDLRVFPRLRFHWDSTPENADRMEELFEKIRKERGEKE